MNKKIKVIQLIDSLSPGGAEMMAVNIANALAEKGTASYLCATRSEGSLKNKLDANVGYLFLNKKHTIDFRALLKLKNYIKINKISVVHAHSSSYFFAFLIKIRLPKIKIIWHDHYGNSENSLNRSKFPLNLISNSFYAIISVNKLLEQWAENFLNTQKVYFIPNFASFNSNTSKRTFLKGEDRKNIVCLANLRPQKDHINLLKAFKIVLQKHPKWTLHLVGLDLDDSYSRKIKTFITKNKLENAVFLYGSREDVEFILEQATIGVLASKSEGLPVSLLEYGLAKLPVIVTDVGDCGKVVQNNVNGLLIEPANYKKLAEAFLKLIKDKKMAKALGEELFKTVNSKFSKESYISKLIKIYNIL